MVKDKITKEQIAEWKSKHKEVHKLEVDGHVGYLKNPNRKTLSLAMSRIAKNDILGGCEAILENCWLGGDDAIKTDDTLFMGATSVVGGLIEVKSAKLAKL